MAYYTYYALSIERDDKRPFTPDEKLAVDTALNKAAFKWFTHNSDITEGNAWESVFTKDDEYAFGYSAADALRWYEATDDLAEFSLQFPNLIFTLIGDGEEKNDYWMNYFKNGEVVYDPVVYTFNGVPNEFYTK